MSRLAFLTTLLLTFLTGSARAQLAADAAMDGATLHRSGVLATKGLGAVTGVDWRTNKFFSINYANNAFKNSNGDLELASLGFSDPIVAGNTLYYRLYPSPGNSLIVAMDPVDGGILWTYKSKEQLSNPSISGGNVYFVSEDRYAYEVNAKTGVQNWKFEVKGKGLSAFSGSPLVHGDELYASTLDGRLVAINTRTRQLKWEFQAAKGLLSPVVFASGTAFVGDEKGGIFALDTSGKQLWTFKAEGQVRTLAFSDGNLYFRTDKGTLHAIDAASGAAKWSLKIGGSYLALYPLASIQVGSPLAIDRGVITFSGKDRGNSYVFGVNAVDGIERWRLKIDEATRSPVIANGIVYYGSFGKLYAIDITSGLLRWEIAYQTDLKGAKVSNVVSSPAVSDGRLHVISDEGIVLAYK